MKFIIGLLLGILLSGCVTTGPPVAGSKVWYEVRMQEIEGAYNFGEITKDQYLELKNEADQIRLDYRSQSQNRLYYDTRIGYYPTHHYYHRSHHHHRYR